MATAYSSPSSFSAYFQVILVLPLLWLFLTQVDAGSMNRSEEVNALLEFIQPVDYFGIDYDNGYRLTWNKSDETPCAWIGVSCTTNYIVDELHFSGWGLTVDLTPLYALKDLRVLDFSSNGAIFNVLGEICGNFTRLTWLDFSGTSLYCDVFSGISACRNLRVLVLENSPMQYGNSAPLPSMSDLVNLQILNLAGNGLTGPFPKVELGDLSNLISLDLSRNGFNGSIPALPNLIRLVELKLDSNYFTEFEDPWFLGTKVLYKLSVSNNSLEGMIPLSITNFPNLQILNMSDNSLSGNIPSGYLGRQRNLSMRLDLSQNQLSGEIPPDLLKPVVSCSDINLNFLNFSYNLLTGNIPYAGSSLSFCFEALDLSHNNLSGTIPWSNFFGSNFSQIIVLHLQHNHLSGDIVDALLGSTFANASEFRAESNLFTGDLSRIANARALFTTMIDVVDLSDNLLQWSVSEAFPDPITATLQVITSIWDLIEFRVGGNNFSGTSFPTACGINTTSCTTLTILDLSNSHLEGEILGEAFDHTCVGSIQLLNLSNNHATGPLPTNLFAQCDPLFVLDVSNNSLSGPLPVILRSSNLNNPKYFLGNDGLCGGPLSPCLPKQGTGVQWWLLLIIIGGSVTIAMGSCSAATWQWRVYKKQHQQDADLIKTLLERDSASLMPLRDLKRATDNFAKSAQIGEGGFGTVYMGKLNDGTIVAIKRSKREGSERDKEQFLNEVRICPK